MKTIIFLAVTLVCSLDALACSCDTPKPAVAFYFSEYVFEGIVTAKTYPKDSLTYKVTFDVLKHYKHGDSPKQLTFTFKSEGSFQGIVTSCDWNVNEDEKWLVYAYRHKGEIVFAYMCGNSKPLGISGVQPTEQRILDNGNDFDPSKYIFATFDGVNTGFQSNDIDSLMKKHSYSKSRPNWVNIMVEIDEKGRLISAAATREWYSAVDSVFGLYTAGSKGFTQPTNAQQDYFLEKVRALEKWKLAFIPYSNTAVKYRRDLQFYY